MSEFRFSPKLTSPVSISSELRKENADGFSLKNVLDALAGELELL